MFVHRGPGLFIGNRYKFTCVVCGTKGVSPSKMTKTCDPIATGRDCRSQQQQKKAREWQDKHRVKA